jgi:hypothetical protein
MAPDLLEKMIAGIERENAQIAFCRFKNVDLQNQPLETPHEQNLHKFVANLQDNRYLLTPKDVGTGGGTQSILWSLFRIMFVTDIIKGQSVYFHVIPFAEDFIFLTDYLAYCKKAYLVDEYLYFYTKQNDGSSTHSRGFHPKMNEVCLMVLRRAKKILAESPLYTQTERESSYQTFALLLAYNMILNVFCATDYVAEYKRSKQTILDMYSLQTLAIYQDSFNETQRAVLKQMQTSGVKELHALLKDNQILK